MILKNCIRFFATNFLLVWKNLVFKSIALAISIFVFISFSREFIIFLSQAEFGESFNFLIYNLSTISIETISTHFATMFDSFINVMILELSAFIYSILGLILSLMIFTFLSGMAEATFCELIRHKMSNSTNVGFIGTFVGKLRVNFKFAVAYTCIYLPLNLGGLIISLSALSLIKLGAVWVFFAPIISIIIIIVISSIVLTALSWWPTLYVIQEISAWDAFKKSIQISKNRFKKYISDAIILVVGLLFINVVFGKYTFYISLIITIPLSYILSLIFKMIVCYNSQGMRYYIDDQIIVPKKFEQLDQLCDAKSVI